MNAITSSKLYKNKIVDSDFKELNIYLKIFLFIIEIIVYPIFGLLSSIFISISCSFIFLFFGVITAFFLPFIPFFFICCLCGENGIIAAKIFLFVSISSLISILVSPFIIVGGFIISILEIFKNYYFFFICKIIPSNKFQKNYNLLLSFTYAYIFKIIEILIRMKDHLIKKSTAKK